jgi:NAD(P)-dependent dehydrogenase (short-subunit alcohol dehydrogenase family)
MARPGPVLVTGANSGIGLATTLELAGRGWQVFGTVRDEQKRDAVGSHAQKAGVDRLVEPVILVVSNHGAVVEAWTELPDFFAVVNNAGYTELGAVEEVSAARVKAQLDVNLVAPAVVCACALPAMRKRGEGRIVMVSSIAGRASLLPLNGWYHASKFGLEALSDILRVEVAQFGVKVVIVEPGFFNTKIEDRAQAHVDRQVSRDNSPYAAAYQRTTSWLKVVGSLAPPPGMVARTIASAIESRWPRRRYVVGVDALAAVATQPFTPRAVTDWAMQWLGGLRSGRF